MSNPNDPMPTSPDPKADPTKAGSKPDATPHGAPERPHTGGSSFDFQLPNDVGSYSDLPPVGQPEEIGASTPYIQLPPRPAAAKPTGGSFDFIELPDVPAPPDDGLDLPFAIETTGDSAIAPVPPVPSNGPASSIFSDAALPMGEPASDLFTVPDLTAPAAPADPPSSFVLGQGVPSALPADPDSGSFVLPAPAQNPAAHAPSTPDISTLLPPPEVPTAPPGTFTGDPAVADLELPVGELDPIDPASGWLDHPVAGPDAPPAARPSFDFTLPEGVRSFGDLPPVPQPVPDDTKTVHAAIPPRPAAAHPAAEAASFDFIELAEDAAPAPGPVAPASGWLDSAIEPGAPAAPAEPAPPAGAASAPLDLGAPGAPDSSDILSGAPAEPALPVDGPEGATVSDGLDDLALAEDVPDSGTFLMGEVADGDSIHEMPDPMANPLFDSVRLSDRPDAHPGSVPDDATDYGAAPALSSDASSILADLSEPFGATGTDSSVRVEEPGVGRTLTVGPADDAFDLTVADEPVPAELFGAAPDGPATDATDATDWQSQSGSDLFADARTGADVDLGADPADAVDLGEVDLGADPVSLSSAPSSIFSDHPAAPPNSGGSADVRPGAPAPAGDPAGAPPADGDAVEFTDHPTLGRTAEPEGEPKPRRAKPDEFEFAAPAAEDGGAIDWDAAGLADDEHATRGIERDASFSALVGSLKDDSSELPTRNERPVARIGEGDGAEGPVVTVDWLASSGEASAVSDAHVAEAPPAPPKKTKGRKEKEPPEERRPKTRPAPPRDEGTDESPRGAPPRSGSGGSGEQPKRKPAPSAKKGGGLLVGAVLGAVLVGGASAGVYFSGLVPNSEKTAQAPPVPPGGPGGSGPGRPGVPGRSGPDGANVPPAPPAAAADPKAAFSAGGTARALELLNAAPPTTTAEKAAAGYVRLFAKVQAGPVAADDAELKQARADLEAVMADAAALKTAEGEKAAVQAAVRLGVSYEVAGDLPKARQVFTDARAKFPKHAAVFEALLDRLDAADRAGATSLRTAPKLDPEDAQRVLFAVSLLLADEAKAEDDPEPGLFYWKAVNQAAGGKYPEAVELIGRARAAHVKRARALAGRGLNPLTDPLEQMFARSCDELAAYWKLRGELYANPAIAAAIKKDGVARTLDALARAEKDLGAAKADAARLDKDLKALKDAADLRTKQYQADEAVANKKIADLTDEREKLEAQARKLKDQVATAEEFTRGVADALKPAVALPEKWAPADVVAGVRATAARATGPDLKALVPSAMTAVGGGGLAAGQLLDIADRLTRAEAAAKVATDKLAAETARLKADHAAALKTLTDDHAAALAKLTEDGAAERKKLTDAYTADARKLTDAHAAERKKLTDAHAAERKKLTDDSAAALAKLKGESEAALKAEQARTAAEKKAAADKDASFQKQLANAVTPAQAMDLWLPTLTDLRRPSDAEPALAAAARARESAAPGSEDAAKAYTVTGMALLLKGNLAGAREAFQTARRGAAYEAARGKAWAKAADAGLEAVDDPLAPYRQPVAVPPVDAKTATRALDTGILAFKAGRYEDAAAALADAAKNDPADPVAWYYLGAARWVRGDTKQAEKDFSQGAEREKASPVPAREVSAALAPIQGTVRDALDRARP